jgi:beta-N-acetylhexosaminidase
MNRKIFILFFLVLSGCVFSNQHAVNEGALKEKIGQLIMVGFIGANANDPEVQAISRQIEEGKIGGLIFYSYNVENPLQIQHLTKHFKALKTKHPLFLAIDQEGGKVKTLQRKNGFKEFPSPKIIASKGLYESYSQYAEMAFLVKQVGFNVVLGPVVDLEYNAFSGQPPSPVIGGLERSFGADPETVIAYAKQFILAQHNYGLLTSLKHFPGHGFAQGDTHKDLVDITLTHHPLERIPFDSLIKEGFADMIMVGHLRHRGMDPKNPATLSKTMIDHLLREKGYQGVIISDCLCMGAIEGHYSLEEIVIKAINAGIDILLFSNHVVLKQRRKSNQDNGPTSPEFVEQVIATIEKAVRERKITLEKIEAASMRVQSLKQWLKEQPTALLP